MGPEVDTALAAAELLNMDCCVVNARFLSPFDAELARKLAEGRTTISIEDHVLSGGLGTALDEALSGAPHGGILHFGWPRPAGSARKSRLPAARVRPDAGSDRGNRAENGRAMNRK